jgi:hypothetical protein
MARIRTTGRPWLIQWLAVPLRIGHRSHQEELPMRLRDDDEWTIERWRPDPGSPYVQLEEPAPSDVVPPLWQDVAVAAGVAVLLWSAAAVVFG